MQERVLVRVAQGCYSSVPVLSVQCTFPRLPAIMSFFGQPPQGNNTQTTGGAAASSGFFGQPPAGQSGGSAFGGSAFGGV